MEGWKEGKREERRDCSSLGGPEPVAHKATELRLSCVKMNFEATQPNSAPPSPERDFHPPLATQVSSGSRAGRGALVTCRESRVVLLPRDARQGEWAQELHKASLASALGQDSIHPFAPRRAQKNGAGPVDLLSAGLCLRGVGQHLR